MPGRERGRIDGRRGLAEFEGVAGGKDFRARPAVEPGGAARWGPGPDREEDVRWVGEVHVYQLSVGLIQFGETARGCVGPVVSNDAKIAAGSKAGEQVAQALVVEEGEHEAGAGAVFGDDFADVLDGDVVGWPASDGAEQEPAGFDAAAG